MSIWFYLYAFKEQTCILLAIGFVSSFPCKLIHDLDKKSVVENPLCYVFFNGNVKANLCNKNENLCNVSPKVYKIKS